MNWKDILLVQNQNSIHQTNSLATNYLKIGNYTTCFSITIFEQIEDYSMIKLNQRLMDWGLKYNYTMWIQIANYQRKAYYTM